MKTYRAYVAMTREFHFDFDEDDIMDGSDPEATAWDIAYDLPERDGDIVHSEVEVVEID